MATLSLFPTYILESLPTCDFRSVDLVLPSDHSIPSKGMNERFNEKDKIVIKGRGNFLPCRGSIAGLARKPIYLSSSLEDRRILFLHLLRFYNVREASRGCEQQAPPYRPCFPPPFPCQQPLSCSMLWSRPGGGGGGVLFRRVGLAILFSFTDVQEGKKSQEEDGICW